MKSQKKVRKNQADSRLTMIIIPQSVAKPIRLSVSGKAVRIAAALAALFVLGSITVAVVFGLNQAEFSRVDVIKEESRLKDETIQMMEQQVQSIEEQQERLVKKQLEIKKMMGIKGEAPNTTQPSRGGQGGSGPERDISQTGDALLRTQQLKNRLDIQEKELDELLAQVTHDREYFLSIPNQWPTGGEISSAYGWRNSPFGGRRESFHDGIDIANESGTEVASAADGKVVFAGWKPVYGRTVLIDHGYGFSTQYSHNSALLVEEGDQVEKGQTIARMGSTGRSTGPHLHFTILKWNETLDPLIYLPDIEENGVKE